MLHYISSLLRNSFDSFVQKKVLEKVEKNIDKNKKML